MLNGFAGGLCDDFAVLFTGMHLLFGILEKEGIAMRVLMFCPIFVFALGVGDALFSGEDAPPKIRKEAITAIVAGVEDRQYELSKIVSEIQDDLDSLELEVDYEMEGTRKSSRLFQKLKHNIERLEKGLDNLLYFSIVEEG